MAKHNTYEPVVFKNSLGETISNDPVFHARRVIEQAESAKVDDSNDELEPNPYADLNGKQLKELAAERGVDISGMKTVGQVREALLAADAAEEETDNQE